MSDRRDRDRRRGGGASRAPSRSRCRFSANTRVSELHKELRQLRAEKTELESLSRKLRRQVGDVKKELRTSQRNEESLRVKIEDFAAAEPTLASDVNKLTRESARLQEDLERAKQMRADVRRSKAAITTEFRDGDVISIGASSERLCLRIGGDSFEAPLATKVCSDHLYYPVLACADMNEDGPVNPGRLPIPGPLLCRKP